MGPDAPSVEPVRAMRSRSFKPSTFFAFRTPLLPFDSLESWMAAATAPGLTGDPRRLEEAVTRDATMQRRRLRSLLERPEVREAIFLASPSLDEALKAWFDDPEGEKGRRAERAVVKYVSRMASRATPSGLFAGTSVGRIGTRTRLNMEPLSSGRRRSRRARANRRRRTIFADRGG